MIVSVIQFCRLILNLTIFCRLTNFCRSVCFCILPSLLAITLILSFGPRKKLNSKFKIFKTTIDYKILEVTVSFKKYLSALEETNEESPKEEAKDIERDVPFGKVSLVINCSTIQLKKEKKFDGFVSDFLNSGKTHNTHSTFIFKTKYIYIFFCSRFVLCLNKALFKKVREKFRAIAKNIPL